MSESSSFPAFGSRYQPIRKIARGGMADVFEARDLLLDRLVALKVLFSELSTNPTFVERFRREAQSAAALSHPNIVSVYDWGPANSTYFIAMELVEGSTLSQVIRESGGLAPQKAAATAADVAMALAFAHRHGVIHRDIKPSNVLITEDGIVKVADFGIARAVTNEEDLTQTGSVLGTATYISPEQARGEDLDGRSDIYSLGVVMYEMLTGAPPFAADTPIAVAYRHVTEAPVPPSKVNPSIPAPLEAIVFRCLAKLRDQRYRDCNELRADLLRYLDDLPVKTPSLIVSGAPTISNPQSGLHDRTQFIAPIDPTSTIPAIQPEPEQKRSKKRRWIAITVVVLLLLLALAGALLGPKLLAAKKKPAVTKVAVPGVVGAQEQGATSSLRQAGFKSTLNFAANSAPAGTVIGERPSGGSKLPQGSLIYLTVSNGPGTVVVPNVEKEQATTAEAKLLALGFNVSTNYQNASASQGTVVNQSPGPDKAAPKGSTVVLTVSNGPAKITVPNVTGLSLAQASNKLGVAGLAVGTTTSQPSTSVPNGDVISTSPAAGTQVAPNSSVNLVVSSGYNTTVPNVVGDTQSAADSAITSAGLTVGTTTSQPSTSVPNGDVISTSPSGGSTATVGSAVNLVVSSGPGPTTPTSG